MNNHLTGLKLGVEVGVGVGVVLGLDMFYIGRNSSSKSPHGKMKFWAFTYDGVFDIERDRFYVL